MKDILIERLFRKFERDKFIIKQNLLQVMDEVVLATSDKYGQATLIIKYKKEEENGKIK